MTHINTPGEMECYLEEEFCAFELTFVRGTSVSCTELIAIEVNGNVYNLNSSIDILFGNAVPPVSEQMEAAIEAALDMYGLFGEASVTIGFTAALELEFQVLVTNSNASSLKLLFEGCAQPEVFTKSEDCCEPGAAPAAGDGGLAGTGNPDLFYEHITYSGLDISRIDMGSNCMTGFMRNEYQYDANHRLTDVRNTFFMPEPVVGLFSSNYTYDLAGNLDTLKRFGLENPTVMGTTPVLIDNLVYAYGQGSSVLNSVTDITSLPQGFAPSTSTYDYDGAGNLDLRTDDGTGLTIGYNLLNLPGTINHPSDGAIRYGYTFGGHKFLKKTELEGEAPETRLYLGGAEFVEGQPESYYHGEGRVALTGSEPRFQYKLTDHLGNTMVLFEDRDGDGIITTESMSPDNPDLVEVLQRNFYYAFGLPMQGPWNHAPADPDMPYLYNGKELEGELGLGWMDYGARRYDAAIGRWGGVDPLAHLYYGWSSYNYVLGNPISFVDPDGRSVEDIIVGGQTWTPGAKWEGDEGDFGHQVFTALNSLHEDIDAGNISTSEATGNVIMDFVGENAPNVEIIEAAEGQGSWASEDGSQIFWNPNDDVMIGPSSDGLNVPGILSSETQLGHEFGHSWLAMFSPKLNAGLEAADAQNMDPDLNEHNAVILPKVENKFSRARGEGVRNTYRNIYQNKAEYEQATGTTGYGDYYLQRND